MESQHLMFFAIKEWGMQGFEETGICDIYKIVL